MGEIARWALYKQFEEVSQFFRTVWQLYLTFYTFSLTFNVATLAFVYSGEIPRANLGWVTFALVGIDLLIMTSSLFVMDYTRGAARQLLAVSSDLTELARASGETLDAARCFRPALPTRLCLWSGAANVAGMLLLVAVWLALYFSGT